MMSQKIELLLDDTGLAEMMGNAGKQRIKEHFILIKIDITGGLANQHFTKADRIARHSARQLFQENT